MPKYKSVLLGADGLAYGAWLCFGVLSMLKLVSVVGALGSVLISLLISLAGSALVLLVVVPVKKGGGRIWGKFHPALAVITLLTSGAVALFWSVDGLSGMALKVILLSAGLLVVSSGATSLHYLCSAIRSRLTPTGRIKKYDAMFRLVGIAIGIGLTVAVYLGFSFAGMGYILAFLVLACGFTVFFVSAPFIPRLINVGEQDGAVVIFDSPIVKRVPAVSAYISAFTAACMVAQTSSLMTQYFGGWGASAAVLITAAAAAVYVLCLYKKPGRRLAFAAAVISAAVSIAAFLIMLFITEQAIGEYGALIAAALSVCYALVGAFGAVAIAFNSEAWSRQRDKSSKGAMLCKKGMATTASVGAATALSSPVLFMEAFAVYLAVVPALLFAASAVLIILPLFDKSRHVEPYKPQEEESEQ